MASEVADGESHNHEEHFLATLKGRMTAEKRRLVAFLQELVNETDRGAALVGAAVLDDRLRELIATNLVESREASELLEGGNAPLGSFSSRCKMAYCLGLLTAEEYEDCNTIRRIRNDFAHKLTGLPFQDQRVKDLCTNLRGYRYYHPFGDLDTARRRFEKAVLELASVLFYRALISSRFAKPTPDLDSYSKLMFVEEAHDWATKGEPDGS